MIPYGVDRIVRLMVTVQLVATVVFCAAVVVTLARWWAA